METTLSRWRCWVVTTAFILSVVLSASAMAEGQNTVRVFGNQGVWQWAPSRTYHVENYRLALRFDESKGEVFGSEVVTLRPFEAHFHRFCLNSSGLTIDSVAVQKPREAVKLTYLAQDRCLWITLDRDYDASSSLNISIVYHGFPRTGLFFVNPTPNYPNTPHEVYSQGEPELNQYWFPCWDYPNDMATSETITTVPEGQSVVSNGHLVKVTRSAGQVIYDWVESTPHSSYLTSVAVGPWRKLTDKYENKPVDYYVLDSVDEATARRSFRLTPDMIGFFSRATGVEYPYEKYAQVAVRNYIFGGQENVSATTLTDFTLHDARADEDYSSTALVAHELGQHWFGDFVQGRDWANIWLNEGFATYLEALYAQHHEGNDAYRLEIYNDQAIEQAVDRKAYRRPIVDRHYTDPMQMIDEITHEKGAVVLDMMRYVLGGTDATTRPASQSEPLFRALHYYLTVHHAQAVDTADLLNAIWTTTGQDLTWFFHEWVYMAGHPDYRVKASYNTTSKIETLKVAQTQAEDAVTPVFDMPIELAFYGANGEKKEIQVRDSLRQQEFNVPLDFEPQWVDFDPNDFIDKSIEFDKSADALIAESEKDPFTMSRLWAVKKLGEKTQASLDARTGALVHVLGNDAFYAVRAAAAASLGSIGTGPAKVALLSALQQPDSRVRTAAVEALGHFPGDHAVVDVFINTLHNDASYAVQAAAADELGRSGAPQAFEVLQALATTGPEVHVLKATLNGLASTKDPRAAAILLAQAKPGVPVRIRLSALAGLAKLKDIVQDDHAQELVEVVRAALDDTFFPIQQAGEQLVDAFDLVQLQPEIQRETQSAPLAQDREAAQQVLEKLHRRQ